MVYAVAISSPCTSNLKLCENFNKTNKIESFALNLHSEYKKLRVNFDSFNLLVHGEGVGAA